MKSGIYFIGGASASGKSTCTKLISAEFGAMKIELDSIYNVIKPSVTDEPLGKQITKDVVAFCVEKFLVAEVSGILEGGWIAPSKAAELLRLYDSRFSPIYCGYPNTDVDVRFEMISKDGKHWLTRKTPEEAHKWLQEQIDGSRWYASECKTHNIPFFDFSDVKKGSEALINHYRSWQSQC